MAEQGRKLRIFRDGRKHERLLTMQLPTGAQANLETLAVMKKIVLEDSKESDLRNLVMRDIIGLDNQTLDAQIDAAFKFCRDAIKYEDEQDGFETVADLWSCLYALKPENPIGDCAIKSVALATCLSFLGLKPFFVAIRQIPNVTFYNHVYVGVVVDGQTIPLDPTPENFKVGEELPSYARQIIKIYE